MHIQGSNLIFKTFLLFSPTSSKILSNMALFTARYIQKTVDALRLDQSKSDLFKWLKHERGAETLSVKKAELMLCRLIAAGYTSLKSLLHFDWSDKTLAKVAGNDDDKRWLSAWLPRKYHYASLGGLWVDSFRHRKCLLVEHENNDQYSQYFATDEKNKNRTRENNENEAMLTCVEKTVTLRAPWGRNGNWRIWTGVVDQNYTRIVWDGRNGKSHWYRLSVDKAE